MGVVIPPPPRDTLTVNPGSLNFDYTQGQQTVTVTTTADSYTDVADDNWITITQNMDGTFTVTASDNNTGQERTTTIRVNAGTADEQTVTVTQAARDTLSATPTTLNFDYNDTDSQAVSVTTTADDYQVTPNEGWISINRTNGTFTVSVEENTGTTGRTGTITVSAGNAEDVTISVTQAAQDILEVEPDNLTFDAVSAPTQTVSVTTSAADYTALSDDNWLTITKNELTGALHVDVEDHDGEDHRPAVIKVSAKNCQEKQVNVLQTAPKVLVTLSVDMTTVNFQASGWNEQWITVNTTADAWDAIPTENWITADIKGRTQFVVRADANTTGKERSGQVIVSAVGAETVTVSIYQK